MTDRAPTDESDLAYLKRIASAGRGEPAPFLLLMAVFGGVYGLALTAATIAFRLDGISAENLEPGPATAFLGPWLFVAAHAVFLAALVWTIWRTVGPHRIPLNRSASAIWSGAFVGLIATYAAILLFSRDQPRTDQLPAAQLLGPMLLILWGCAWWATAIASDRRWLLSVAIGSFAAAVALCWVGGTPVALVIMCACLILLAFLPAVLLMRARQG